MELILVKPVRKLGKIGEIVKVKDGFGRNYLLPQSFAIRATEKNKKLIEEERSNLELKNAQAKAAAELLAKSIEGKDVAFIKQCADDGRLFGSVSNKEIAKELSKVISQEVVYSAIHLETPIKSLGVFPVKVHLHTEVDANIVVVVARSDSEILDALKQYKASSKIDTQELPQ